MKYSIPAMQEIFGSFFELFEHLIFGIIGLSGSEGDHVAIKQV